MEMDGCHKDVNSSGSCSRNCIDIIKRQSVGMGVHKAKKFFNLRGESAKSGQCYSDLVYDAHQRPQRDIDDQKGPVVMTDTMLTGEHRVGISDDGMAYGIAYSEGV